MHYLSPPHSMEDKRLEAISSLRLMYGCSKANEIYDITYVYFTNDLDVIQIA